ncbi:MAG: hypothetical protein D3908_01945 [Candidatus Electrothrix sp. AUS4]|nr:hypothetical protein [Candidatus Electrothrix sp. AUS4]
MISFEETASKPNELIAMTGYTPEEFRALLPAFEKEIIESDWTLEGKERKNTPTVYKKSAFSSIADQLFFYIDLYETVHDSNCAGKIVRNIST